MQMNILVIGNFQQTVTIIRSLGRNGYGVVIAKPSRNPVFTQYSRYVTDVWIHPPRDGDEFFPALTECLRSRDIRCILPVGDADHHLICSHLDELPTDVDLVSPGPDVLRRCLDKGEAYLAAEQAGVPVPHQEIAHSLEEVHSGAEVVGFPCIVKPVDSLRFFWGKKALKFRNREELHDAFTTWPEGNDQLIVQEFATGQRHNCDLLATDGRLTDYFELKVLRTNFYNGTGLFVDGVSIPPDPRLREHCANLLQVLHYDGPAMVQFLVDDERGTVRFLEINPRLDAFSAVAYHSGYDFPLLSVQQALGAQPPRSRKPQDYRTGVRVHWLLGDLTGLWRAVTEKEIDTSDATHWLLNIAITSVRTRRHITWSWRDPAPTLYMYAEFFRERLRGVTRFLRRSFLVIIPK